MLRYIFAVLIFCISFLIQGIAKPIIIDHTCTDLTKVPEHILSYSRNTFKVAYNYSSYGSQVVTGMSLFKNDSLFSYGTKKGELYFAENAITGAEDLGNPDRTTWFEATRTYLKQNIAINIVMWSWGGQANTSESNINIYLNLMDSLEKEFPNVKFVYMTGHLVPPSAGGCEAGQLNQRNEQIRKFCRDNDKILFDFADIESYNPDGEYFLDDCSDDGCNYYAPDGKKIGNWADEWCEQNPEQCQDCDCKFSHSLNCMQKGKAFWWMMARLGGWDGVPGSIVATPVILLPKKGIVVDSTNFMIAWKRINNAVEYDVQVSKDSLFGNVIVDEKVTDTVYQANVYDKGIKYFIRVKAGSELSESVWSSASDVIVRLDKPLLTNPVNGETVEGTDIALLWNAVQNAQQYKTEIYSDSALKIKFAENTGVNMRFVPDSLELGKKYYWRVKSINPIVESFWSEINWFRCFPTDKPEMTLEFDTLIFQNTGIGTEGYLPFNIMNTGTGKLSITGISLDVASDTVFKVVESAFPYDIDKDEFLEFHLTFRPTLEKLYNGNILIASNADTVVKMVSVTGKGVPSTEVKSFNIDDFPEVKYFPNPCYEGQSINLEILSRQRTFVEVNIFNLVGFKTASTIKEQLYLGKNYVQLNTNNLNTGVYTMVIVINEKRNYLPIMILK